MKTFYLTTPIYYPNARPHVGSAYTTIVCDVIARYKRMSGYDVAFLTGTDEHGEKLQRAAEAAGKSPAQFVAEKRELFKELWRKLGIGEFRDLSAPDGDVAAGSSRQEEDGSVKPPLPPIKRLFVHTSQNPDHVKSVHWMIRQAKKAGYIEKKKYEGRYCVHDERYVSDGTEPADCDICGRPAELISEDNYFFRLSAFQEDLREHYKEHPDFVHPDFRFNEVKSFVKSGLRDISISRRRLKWGIPWPDDPEQVVYVWYDALTSYLTGIGFRGEQRSKDFEKFWMGAEGSTEVVHMIGKDILRFHAVYWPAFLMAAGLPLPKTIFAHGWIYYEQDKMSKSKGNVVYPEPIVEALDSFGAPGNDALRYYLLRDTPFGLDGNFSYNGLVDRYNFDLANDLGNLAKRTVTMLNQYFRGKVPDYIAALRQKDQYNPDAADAEKTSMERTFSDYRGRLDAYNFSAALEITWQRIGQINKSLADSHPWKLAEKDFQANEGSIAAILYRAAEVVRCSAVLLYPVTPDSAERTWKQLGCEGHVRDQRIDQLQWGQLKPGTKVGKPEAIFPRLDKEATLVKLHELAEADFERDKPKEAWTSVQNETDKTQKASPPPTAESRAPNPESRPSAPTPDSLLPTPAAPKISIEDFAKVEMLVGEVLSAERIPNATKLLKIMVDIGTEVRQVLAGIAEHYQPEQLVGMKVVVVTNLQPRKMRGLESNGMIVAASVGEEGRPVLVTFKDDVPKGARLK